MSIGLGAAWFLKRPGWITETVQNQTPSVSATGTPVSAPSPAPRLSIVVLPFGNLAHDNKDDYLADAITDDLTTDLSRIAGAFVVARESAYTYKGKATDVRQIGRELGVRYVWKAACAGSMTHSGQRSADLRRDRRASLVGPVRRRDQPTGRRAAADHSADVRHDWPQPGGDRERAQPTRATNQPRRIRSYPAGALTPAPASQSGAGREALTLYERALLLDPSSVTALARVANFLVETMPDGGWGTFENMQRAGRLLARARTIAPQSAEVLNITVLWLRTVGRCQEVIEAAQHAIQTDPNRMRMWTGVYNELAVCKIRTGHAEEAIALQAKADQLNPRSPWKYSRYRQMGLASLLLGRDEDAITLIQRSTCNESGSQGQPKSIAGLRRPMCEPARSTRQSAGWPHQTGSGPITRFAVSIPQELSSPVYIQQMRDYQAALRLAGARDHADEEADFDAKSEGSLYSEVAGYTPVAAPGVPMVRTAELVPFLADVRPLVIDTVSNSWGRSIPGAIGLKFSGLGGSFTDEAQDRLRRKMVELTRGNLNQPVVAVGWNAEHFDGRNLALRLVALGYTNVFWHRGGREAWEVAGLPESELVMQDW